MAEDGEGGALAQVLDGVGGGGFGVAGELAVDPGAASVDEFGDFGVGGSVGAADDEVAGGCDVDVERGSGVVWRVTVVAPTRMVRLFWVTVFGSLLSGIG